MSSLDTAHPHWIEVKLKQPATIGSVVVRFADPAGYPTSFQGLVRVGGKDRRVFEVANYKNPRYFRQTIAPVTTDTFRLVVRASANPAYRNAAQISEIELYPPRPLAGPPLDHFKADRIVFLGNSITLHGPSDAVQWAGNWGMAASEQEKDYVHLVANGLAQRTGKRPAIMVANIADFERGHATYDIDGNFKKFFDFKPDIVVVAIGENVPALSSKQAQTAYQTAFLKLLEAIQRQGKPAVYVRSCFWGDPTKDAISAASAAQRRASTTLTLAVWAGTRRTRPATSGISPTAAWPVTRATKACRPWRTRCCGPSCHERGFRRLALHGPDCFRRERSVGGHDLRLREPKTF